MRAMSGGLIILALMMGVWAALGLADSGGCQAGPLESLAYCSIVTRSVAVRGRWPKDG